jgi:hypothetical protein
MLCFALALLMWFVGDSPMLAKHVRYMLFTVWSYSAADMCKEKLNRIRQGFVRLCSSSNAYLDDDDFAEVGFTLGNCRWAVDSSLLAVSF